MTRVALMGQTAKVDYFGPLLRANAPELEVVVWPDPAFREAEVAVGWNAPPGVYAQMPRLRLVHSIAAGVDNVIVGSSGYAEGGDAEGIALQRELGAVGDRTGIRIVGPNCNGIYSGTHRVSIGFNSGHERVHRPAYRPSDRPARRRQHRRRGRVAVPVREHGRPGRP